MNIVFIVLLFYVSGRSGDIFCPNVQLTDADFLDMSMGLATR